MNEVIESILRHDQPRIDASAKNVKALTLDRLNLLNSIIRSKVDVILTAAGTTTRDVHIQNNMNH